MATKTRRDLILDGISDLVVDFMHYDRKDDEDLPRGAIEAAIEAGEVTVDDMIQVFAVNLRKAAPSARRTT